MSFIFQSYLVKMFLFFNEGNLQFPEMVLTYEINRNFSKYMNFLISEVYKSFFKQKLPRVLPPLKEILHFSLEKRIGDWILMEEGIVIRVYGFVHPPYVLPAFLTPGIFSLDLIGQKLMVENEHFINFKKSSQIKFPWVVSQPIHHKEEGFFASGGEFIEGNEIS